MKNLLSNKGLLFKAVACVALLFLIMTILLPVAQDAQTGGKTMLAQFIPYGYDYTAIDMDVLTEKVRVCVEKEVAVDFIANYSNGYSNLIITAEPAAPLETAKLLEMLSNDYPDLEIESFDTYSFAGTTTRFAVWMKILVLALFFELVLLLMRYCLRKDAGWFRSLTVVAVLSVCITFGFLFIARVPFGKRFIAAETAAMLVSYLLCNWNVSNYTVLAKSMKNRLEEAEEKAVKMNLDVTLDAVLVSIIALAGLTVGSILSGNNSSVFLALSLSLPVMISAALSSVFAIHVYKK